MMHIYYLFKQKKSIILRQKEPLDKDVKYYADIIIRGNIY